MINTFVALTSNMRGVFEFQIDIEFIRNYIDIRAQKTSDSHPFSLTLVDDWLSIQGVITM